MRSNVVRSKSEMFGVWFQDGRMKPRAPGKGSHVHVSTRLYSVSPM